MADCFGYAQMWFFVLSCSSRCAIVVCQVDL
jgi:hypothetical protein